MLAIGFGPLVPWGCADQGHTFDCMPVEEHERKVKGMGNAIAELEGRCAVMMQQRYAPSRLVVNFAVAMAGA